MVRYSIESNRLPSWNYANNAVYFISIVTQDKVCHPDRIENSAMIFSDFSKIIE